MTGVVLYDELDGELAGFLFFILVAAITKKWVGLIIDNVTFNRI